MNVYVRRRLIAGGALVLLIAGGVSAVALTGGGSAPPASGAAKLVPATALAYVHVSTDPGRHGTRRAATLLHRLPGLERAANGLVAALARTGHGLGVDYRRDIAPWIGKEAALALIDAGNGVASSEIVVGVRDERGARGFLARLGAPTRRERVAGVELDDYGGQAVALVSGYLVTGPDAIVRAAIFLAHGRGAALAGATAFRRAMTGAPSDRGLDAYASSGGIDRVLAPAPGPLGVLGTLLARPGLQAAALAVSVRAQAADVWVHQLGGGGRGFAPTLAAAVPAHAIAFLDVAGLERALPKLLALAAKAGLGAAPLAQRAAAAGVDLRSLAPLVSGETAIALTGGAPLPTLTIVARTASEARARTALAALQAPLARALGTASTVPTFTQRAVAGVTAYRLRVSPALELDYAVGKGRIAVSTGLSGIAAAFAGKGGLAGDPTYRAAVTGGSSSTTSILFLDLDQLLRLGAQMGLDQDPRFLAVRSDLRRVHAVGLTASDGEADTTAELSLQIP